jgi:hypothetical protein
MSYKLSFFEGPNFPPFLVDRDGTVQYGKPIEYYNNYIIGSLEDPNWKPYPMEQYPSILERALDSIDPYVAITNYRYDDRNYAMYVMPSPSMNFADAKITTYTNLLRTYFTQKITREDKEQARAFEERAQRQDMNYINYKMSEINKLEKEIVKNSKKLKKVEEDIEKVQDKAKKYVKDKVKEGMKEKDAEMLFAKENKNVADELQSKKNTLTSKLEEDQEALEMKTYQVQRRASLGNYY